MSTPARDAEELIRRLEGPRIWNYRLELAGVLLLAALVLARLYVPMQSKPRGEVELPLRVPAAMAPIAAGTRVTLVVTDKDKTPVIVAARVVWHDPPAVVVALRREDALRVAQLMPAEVTLLLEPR
ncbi:MAG TPA: hypothetical protein VKB93_00305 [Thermoanaerobaculia bacterium]|nr:hypothetical protein [Thermoanaerobaculia bacterium]